MIFRRKHSAFTTAVSIAILMGVLSIVGSVMLFGTNIAFDTERQRIGNYYETNINLVKEAHVIEVEDVWLSKVPADYVNMTLINAGDIAIKIKEVRITVLDSAGNAVGCVGPPSCTKTVVAPFNPNNSNGVISSGQALRIEVGNIDWDHINSKSLDISITTERGSIARIMKNVADDSRSNLLSIKTGTCTIVNGASSVSCAISPAHKDKTKTFMLFQATSNNDTPASSSVRCYLESTVEIKCERYGTTGTVKLNWQTAEFANGVKVEHLKPPCISRITNVSITPVGSMSNTFLLFSSLRHGVSQDGDDFRTVRLTSPSNVRIEFSPTDNCNESWEIQNALQVVQFTGASVTRGTTGIMGETSLSVPATAVDTKKTMLIYSYRSNGSGADMCERMVRGVITSPTSLTFSRGDNGVNCEAEAIEDIAWERVEFVDGATVQQITTAMAAGVGTANVAIDAVDLSRTVVVGGGQWTAGQATGEGSYNTNDVIGAMVGRHKLTSTTNLQVERDNTQGTARWTSYVVQFG